MKKWNKIILVFSFLLMSTFLFSQNERLIIGRTTGKLWVKKDLEIRTFGFTDALSAQVTLPGSFIEAKEGDSISIDFWNISQGNPVSLYCKEIEFVQRDKENEILKKKEAIHHMEHGFYSFLSPKTGTYFYYSPENYPFNLQAGMFGVIVIRPKENDIKQQNEILWCSSEIDTKWHTDAIMGTEYDSSNKPIKLPAYKPNYFLINGKIAAQNKGLQSVDNKNKSVVLRLVNAGLYLHEIVFPLNAKLDFISGNKTNLIALPQGYKVELHPEECIELLASLENVTDTEKVSYHFIDPILKKTFYTAAIPIFY